MKRIALVLIVALMSTMAMNAQPQHGAGMAQNRLEQLDKALGLSSDQKAQVSKILKDGMSQMRNERLSKKDGEKNDQADRQSRRERIEKQRSAIDAQINNVLTPEQRKKFEQFRKEEHKRDAQSGPRNRGHRDHHKKGPKDGGCCQPDKSKGCCEQSKADKPKGCCEQPKADK